MRKSLAETCVHNPPHSSALVAYICLCRLSKPPLPHPLITGSTVVPFVVIGLELVVWNHAAASYKQTTAANPNTKSPLQALDAFDISSPQVFFPGGRMGSMDVINRPSMDTHLLPSQPLVAELTYSPPTLTGAGHR